MTSSGRFHPVQLLLRQHFLALQAAGFPLVFISDHHKDTASGEFMFLGGPLVIDGRTSCNDPRLGGAATLADLVTNVWQVVTKSGIGLGRPNDTPQILVWDGNDFVAGVRREEGCFRREA